jgi:hypothetical protein
MDLTRTPKPSRRNVLRNALALAAGGAAAGALARPAPAKAATQTGPLEITGSTPHLVLTGTGTVGDFGGPGKEPSIYRAAKNRLGVRASALIVGPWPQDIDHSPTTGTYSSAIVLARDTVNNDNTIHFCNVKQAGTGALAIQTTWAFEQAGNNDLVIKSVHRTLGDGVAQSGVFRTRFDMRWPGEVNEDDHCHIAVVNSNLGVFDAENWTPAHFGGGKGILAMHNREVAPGQNPVSGVFIYAENGALKVRGGNGTVTTLAPA